MYEQLTFFGAALPSNQESEVMLYDIIDFWYNNYAAVMKSGTADCYKSSVKRTKKFIANTQMSSLLDVNVQKGLNDMAAAGYSKSCIKKTITVLRQSFRCAKRNNKISGYPVLDLIIPPNAAEKKIRALTVQEQQNIEYCCEQTRYGYLTIFLLQTGLRTAELCNLTWNDYVSGTDAHVIINQSKTSAGVRVVPLTSTAESIIKAQPCCGNYIFLSERGKKMSAAIFKDHNSILRSLSGINDFHNHVCRHTFATRALERGMNVMALSAILGHKSVAFTMQRYAYAMNGWLFEQMRLFAEAL